MMDLGKKRSESMEPQNKTKTCSGCHTMKTPLWRGGPNGPKSLCNACGIKYNKKRRAVLGLDNQKKKQQQQQQNKRKMMNKNEVRDCLKLRLMMGVKRSANFGEEEEAALLLMALSCGSMYF